jgi:hypothetical protein
VTVKRNFRTVTATNFIGPAQGLTEQHQILVAGNVKQLNYFNNTNSTYQMLWCWYWCIWYCWYLLQSFYKYTFYTNGVLVKAFGSI